MHAVKINFQITKLVRTQLHGTAAVVRQNFCTEFTCTSLHGYTILKPNIHVLPNPTSMLHGMGMQNFVQSTYCCLINSWISETQHVVFISLSITYDINVSFLFI